MYSFGKEKFSYTKAREFNTIRFEVLNIQKPIKTKKCNWPIHLEATQKIVERNARA